MGGGSQGGVYMFWFSILSEYVFSDCLLNSIGRHLRYAISPICDRGGYSQVGPKTSLRAIGHSRYHSNATRRIRSVFAEHLIGNDIFDCMSIKQVQNP